MKRRAGVMVLLASLASWGHSTAWAGGYMSQVWNKPTDGVSGGAYAVQEAGNFVGPYGQPVPVTAPPASDETAGTEYARTMLQKNFPPELVAQAFGNESNSGGIQLTGGVPPGIGGPGPALPIGPIPGGLRNPPGAVAAIGALTGPSARRSPCSAPRCASSARPA